MAWKKPTQAELKSILQRKKLFRSHLQKLKEFKKDKFIETGRKFEIELNNQYSVEKDASGYNIQMLTGTDSDKELCPKYARSISDMALLLVSFDREPVGSRG